MDNLIDQYGIINQRIAELEETKTEAMVITNKKETTMNIKLKGKPLNQVNEFKYFGSIITANNSSTTDIKRKLGLATGVFGKLDKMKLR